MIMLGGAWVLAQLGVLDGVLSGAIQGAVVGGMIESGFPSTARRSREWLAERIGA